MAGRGRYDTTTGPLPLEPPRLLVALAIVALLGGLGAVFGRMAGSGRAVIAAGGSGGNSGGAGGGSNGSSSGSSGHSGGSNRNRSGTTPGAAPGRSAPNDGSSGPSTG